MKHYKNENNEVYAFELDGSQDELIKPDMVEMTPEEVEAHKNPPPIPPTPAQQLAASDADMIRLIEDLTNTLITKGLIVEADLPQAAQDKLNNRKALRAQL
jgi:hypothetical protein